MGDKRVDLKGFRRRCGTRFLSYASAGDLGSIMGLEPGSVTPLGFLNDGERKAALFLDVDLADGIVGVHPGGNTATVWMQAADCVRVVENHGNEVHVVELQPRPWRSWSVSRGRLISCYVLRCIIGGVADAVTISIRRVAWAESCGALPAPRVAIGRNQQDARGGKWLFLVRIF